MQDTERHMQRVSFLTRPAVVLCCLLSLACASAPEARAQSGRRVPKRPPTVVVPPSETRQEPKPASTKTAESETSLYVCMGDLDLVETIPLYLYDMVRDAFIQRLKEGSGIKVTVGGRATRSEAIKRAKSEQSASVVLLEVNVDSLDARRTGTTIDDSSRLVINYALFAPITGKTRLQGRVYQQEYRAGRGRIGIGVPSRRNTPLYSEYLLKEAAREAADRILEELRSGKPPRLPGLDVR